MAKPIRATPELRNSEAEKFIKRMVEREREKITQKDSLLAEAINSVGLLVH